jgi:tetratricopeptide (TPR) repeat protein
LVFASRTRYEEATQALREALRLDPTYYPAQLKYGDSLLASGHLAEAKTLFEEIIRVFPESSQAHYGLGQARAQEKDYRGAVESLQKACQIFPNYAAAHFALARAYQRLSDAQQTAIEIKLSKQSQGAVPEVEDEILAEVRLLSRDSDYFFRLGGVLEHNGNLEQAAAAYEKTLEINPQLPEPHIRLIHLYGRMGQVGQAEQHYRESLRLDPNRAEVYLYHGALLLGQGKSQEAEESFRKVIELNPQHAEAHSNLGYVLEGRGEAPAAMAEFRKALEISPEFPQAHFNLGRVLVTQENYEEGIPHLLKALATKDQASKTSYLHALGIAFSSVGDLESAIRYLHLARAKAVANKETKLLAGIEEDLRLLQGSLTAP